MKNSDQKINPSESSGDDSNSAGDPSSKTSRGQSSSDANTDNFQKDCEQANSSSENDKECVVDCEKYKKDEDDSKLSEKEDRGARRNSGETVGTPERTNTDGDSLDFTLPKMRKKGVTSPLESPNAPPVNISVNSCYEDNEIELTTFIAQKEKRLSSCSLLDNIDLEAIKKSGNEVLSNVVEGIINSCEPNEDVAVDAVAGAPVIPGAAAMAQANLETIKEGEVLDIPEDGVMGPLSSSPPATVSPAVPGKVATFTFGDFVSTIKVYLIMWV